MRALHNGFGRLDKVSRLTLLHPYWHQALTAGERLGETDLVLLRGYLPEVSMG